MIAIRGLEQDFGDFRLRVDSLDVGAGAYAVVLGPSGSGKSLLLSAVAGLYRPARGRIEIGGQRVDDRPAERRGLGMVFQEPSLFPHLSVRDNVAYGLTVRRAAPALRREKVAALAEALHLGELLDRPVRSLSGGEAQMVALARSLAIEPRVLLLDEPLSQVDHQARAALIGELARVHRERDLTILHVTHDRSEAQALGSELAIMMGGRILQHGPAEAVRAAPACPFVAEFLGLDRASADRADCPRPCLAGRGRCARDTGGARG